VPDRDTQAAQRVVFRKWRDSGNVIALFPAIPATIHGEYCLSYEHVGQHAAADYHAVIRHTRPAAPQEYAALADELTRIGYRLKPQRRAAWRQRGRGHRLATAPATDTR
jgi:hypothetical protein